MITRIRDVRLARKMTLQDVAQRCDPPTTPQTIGRLETGSRTVSVAWLNRIARALGVEAADLVALPDREDIPLVAVLGHDGSAQEPRRPGVVVPPRAEPGLVAISVESATGDYRSGDQIWCRRLEPEHYGSALNRDILLPRPNGRFLFARLIGRESGKLHLLPFGAGQRQVVIADPPWAAVAVKLIRAV